MTERVSVQKLRELLQQPNFKKVINDDGSIALPKSAVFCELSSIIGKLDPLSPKNIYTILNLNRYNMHSFILNFYGINYQKPFNQNSTLDDSSAGLLLFTIDLTTIWKDIEIEEVTYNCKNGTSKSMCTLKRKTWTNYLFEEIFKKTKINCPLSFRHNRFSKSGYALTVIAVCTECNAKFTGIIANEPLENEKILMECQVENYDETFIHEKKRQLKGSRRKEVATELVEGKVLPSIWRRNEANRLMEYGDKEPPHLFRTSTLRKAKQEHQDKFLGITKSNVYESLHNLKYASNTEGAIRSIGLDPFFIHYFTNEQIGVFQKYHDSFLIDSTGSLIKKINLPNGELSPHLFLYQAVTKIGNGMYVPVCQMVSASQNTNTISYWLFEFLRIGSTHTSTFPVPKEVVTDFSKALLGAVARTFARKNSLADYVTHCFQLLLQTETVTPNCLIRLDVCHFMNMVARWKCWHNCPKRVKQFYLRSIAALREQDSLEGVESHATAIFIVAQSECQNNNNITDKSKQFLCHSIRGTDVEEKYLQIEEENDDVVDDFEFSDTNAFQWTNNLLERTKREIADLNETGDINPYHCPKVAENLKKLLPYFPLFSDVMVPIFKYGSKRPTSAGVESEFNDLKNRVLQDVTTMRVDKFILRHISSFPGKLKIGLAQEESKTENTQIEADVNEVCHSEKPKINVCNDSEEITELKEEENWRQKNKRRKYTRYVDHVPEYNLNQDLFTTLPVILNGTFCKNVRANGKIYIINNTCAFDSICQIIATALKNCVKYRELVEPLHIEVVNAASTLIIDGLKNNKFYTERAEIFENLTLYNKGRSRSNIIKIDGNINVGNLANSLFQSCCSCRVTKICIECNKTVFRDHATICANLEIIKTDLNKIKEAIINAFEEPGECCGKKRTFHISYGPHIIVETDIGTSRNIPLHSIPQTLAMADDRSYRLAGVIAYSGAYNEKAIGHYTAYIPIADYWQQFDDASAKSSSYRLENNCEINANMCIYVIT